MFVYIASSSLAIYSYKEDLSLPRNSHTSFVYSVAQIASVYSIIHSVISSPLLCLILPALSVLFLMIVIMLVIQILLVIIICFVLVTACKSYLAALTTLHAIANFDQGFVLLILSFQVSEFNAIVS